MERCSMFMVRKTKYCQGLSCSQLDYRFEVIPVEIPANYSVDIDKLILKFIWQGKRLRIAYSITQY